MIGKELHNFVTLSRQRSIRKGKISLKSCVFSMPFSIINIVEVVWHWKFT